jgi:cysteine sulfinate desulfinase/cysteine desulfurase-like protein
MAMGLNESLARSSIRVSFGPGNTMADAEALVAALVKSRNRLKGMAGIT